MLNRVGKNDGLRPKGLMRILSGLMVGVFLLTNTGVSFAEFTVARTAPAITAEIFVDSDVDGDDLGDDWEVANFGDLTTVEDPDGDFDNDNRTNYWEYRHRTDPKDPNDPRNSAAARNRALDFLIAAMDYYTSSGKRMLLGYVDKDTGAAVDGSGRTYDNALAVMAFLNAGGESITRARDILDAYIWFQKNDPIRDPQLPAIGDGRIRKAYKADIEIPMNDLAEGCAAWFADADQDVGGMAFMILAALRYHE